MRSTLGALLVTLALLAATPAAAAPKASYIHLQILDRSEIPTLTRVVDIATVRGHDVWAFATDRMLEELGARGYAWELVDLPGHNAKVKMASSADELQKTWQDYPTYGQYLDLMQGFAAAHPDICRLVEIGTSQQGRKLLALKITDHPDVAEDEPEVFYSATMHGNEPAGYVLMLRLIDQILRGYGHDPRLTNLVDEVELWINPLANPDGTYAGGDDTVKLATRALANGVNLNRNFPDFTAGEHPDGNAWAPETFAFMQFAAAHPIALAANFHTGNEVVNYPWDSTAARHPEDAWFMAIARGYATQAQADGPTHYMTELDNGITNGFDWFQVLGGRQDYMVYFHASREVTIELYDKYLLNGNELERVWTANRTAMLAYAEHALTGVRGLVTNKASAPLPATIRVLGIPAVGADVATDPVVGDYHRMLLPGTYQLHFEAPGYMPVDRTVTVPAQGAARLDVVLTRHL
jgi:hypothetical protein